MSKFHPSGVQRLTSAEGEQPARQVCAAPCRLLDAVDQPRPPQRVVGALQELRAAGNNSQQIVEIMRNSAGELADRLQLLCLEQKTLRLLPGGRLLIDAPLEVRIHQFERSVGLVQSGGALGDPAIQFVIAAYQRVVGGHQFFGKRLRLLEGNDEFLVRRTVLRLAGLLLRQHFQRAGQIDPQTACLLLG